MLELRIFRNDLISKSTLISGASSFKDRLHFLNRQKVKLTLFPGKYEHQIFLPFIRKMCLLKHLSFILEMNKSVSFVWFVFILFCGCANTPQNYDNTGLVSISVPNAIDIDDVCIYKDLEYIILEEKEKSLFGDVTKMRSYKNRIYILDQYYAKSLFIYTSEGKHIATIGDQKGSGPLEFISISNFEIDYVNNQILTVDDLGRKFMIYDLEGKFIKRIDSEIPIFNAVLLQNGFILHARAGWEYSIPITGNSQIIIADNNKKIIKKDFEKKGNKNLSIHVKDIIRSQLDGGFSFAPEFRDTIYSVSIDSIKPKYAINYGNNRKISEKMLDDINNTSDFYSLVNSGMACFLGHHVESDDFLFFALGAGKYFIYVFYNKITYNTKAITNRKNGKKYNTELYFLKCSDSDGYFYGAFNSTDIEELIELFPKLSNQKKEGNPIIFRYKLNI